MLLKINQIKCPVETPFDAACIARKLHASERDILQYEIERESLDAREDTLFYSYTVLAEVRNGQRYLKRKDVQEGHRKTYTPPSPLTSEERPLVVGFGPSGMFSALLLAECGLKPIVIERGKPVEQRSLDIEKFFTEGILCCESNVQFGEGGAGTFSDGKLTTRMKDIRVKKVLEEFIEAGADPAIAYQHRPHIGTDVLQVLVRNIRNKILSLGGDILFETRLDSVRLRNGGVVEALTNKGPFAAEHLLLCAGHSASDTYRALYEEGVCMIQKDFAAGVRVEHPQALINQNQYGKYAGSARLGAASYALTFHSSNGRGVYSFCMCPGGVVIPSSSEEGTLAVNGMSYSKRDGHNANSAILVQIPTRDFDHGHPLDGFTFQKELEKKSYFDGYMAPSMNISEYTEQKTPSALVLSSSYPRGTLLYDMHQLFSEEVNASLEEGFRYFDRKIPGFLSQGIMVGMESRSSSPIRIPRNEAGESIQVQGLYPCGEGAGYAGGIVSSAVDGIRQAENVIEDIRKKEM